MLNFLSGIQRQTVYLITVVFLFGIVLLIAVVFTPIMACELPVTHFNVSEVKEVVTSFCAEKMSARPSSVTFSPYLNFTYVYCELTNDDGWTKFSYFTRQDFESWLMKKDPLAYGGTVL